MARRRESGLEIVASMPWPAGIVLGLVGYLVIRHGVGAYFLATGNPQLAGLGGIAQRGVFAPIGWFLLAVCWIAAVVSFVGRARRRRLLDSQTGLDSLREMDWRQFEQLAGEAFRRQGYRIEETGLGGADGGIDLVLRRDGQTTLVQCKQWKNRQVGVNVVREMYGLLVHHGATAVKIVALGDYTSDARRFAQGKPIELIHGGDLVATVRNLQSPRTRPPRLLDTPLALIGSMVAGLLLIGAVSVASGSASERVPPRSPVPLEADRPAPPPDRHPALAPPTAPARHVPAQATHPQPAVYASTPMSDAELRDWKKRNAAAMKILDKTTKEVPLR
ncbi:restriction endonuclease [Dyella ginsengisoli]|uniref:restriction endonuclease n=1 Tax=Dyella ginsengisoli TaxID=363848 RepID=UPI00034704FE|nr:restriction endonuclease [Dyella ginsengisoli]